jgi:serine/threonine protein kinase
VEPQTSLVILQFFPTILAPEVLEGNHYNKAVDYWSLGVVMYQILEGISPFQFTGDFAKLLRSILEEPLPPTKSASPAAQALLTEVTTFYIFLMFS